MTATPSETHEAALSDERLRECPCCGTNAIWNPRETTTNGGPVTYNLDLGFVECVMGCLRTPGLQSRAVATASWNRRTQPNAGEPVAYMWHDARHWWFTEDAAMAQRKRDHNFTVTPLYATPPDQSRVERLEAAGTTLLELLDDYMTVSSITANDRYRAALEAFRQALHGDRP